eukprot:SAG22_NODE_2086_length_3031_cov_4.223056_4_plen_42_part_00
MLIGGAGAGRNDPLCHCQEDCPIYPDRSMGCLWLFRARRHC